MEEDYSYRFYIDSIDDNDTQQCIECECDPCECEMRRKRYIIWLQDQSLQRELTAEEIAIIEEQIAEMYPETRELNDERETPEEVTDYVNDEI